MVLTPRLDDLYSIYADVRDHKHGSPLFNSKARKEWDNLMKHVRAGCLSDPHGLSLYTLRSRHGNVRAVDNENISAAAGDDASLMMRGSCFRGTSDLGK